MSECRVAPRRRVARRAAPAAVKPAVVPRHVLSECLTGRSRPGPLPEIAAVSPYKSPTFSPCLWPRLDADVGRRPSLDDLIRPRPERSMDREAKRVGRPQVDDQFELRGLLDGEVAGLGPPEDFVGEERRLAPEFGAVW